MLFNNYNDNHDNGTSEHDDDEDDDAVWLLAIKKDIVRTISQRLCNPPWCVTVWGTGAC